MSSIIYEKKKDIAYLFLNRPERRNAIDTHLSEEIIEHLELFKKDKDVRVLILSAIGDKAFCSGIDLKESVEDENGWKKRASSRGKLFETIIETWKCQQQF